MKMSGKFRTLRADEIDVRVSQSDPQRGVSLLLYKDARADMTILDETVGAENWQRRHTRDNANCIVSIWDEKKSQWIEKEDTGTESNTEKEKGLASDSFKRACTNWGIGRELYTSPFIWVNADKIAWKQKNGKTIPDATFKVAKINYDNTGNIVDLQISESNNIVFDMKKKNSKSNIKKEIPQTQRTRPIKVKDVPAVQIKKTTCDELLAEIHRTGTDINKVCDGYKIKQLSELSEEQAQKALTALKKRPTQNAGVV
jgi:hypothetical protein